MKLTELSDEFLKCRRPGSHLWDDVPVKEVTSGTKNKQVYKVGPRIDILAERCLRCGQYKERVYDRGNGNKVLERREYPDGYQLTGKQPAIETRKEWLARRPGGRKHRSSSRGKKAA